MYEYGAYEFSYPLKKSILRGHAESELKQLEKLIIRQPKLAVVWIDSSSSFFLWSMRVIAFISSVHYLLWVRQVGIRMDRCTVVLPWKNGFMAALNNCTYSYVCSIKFHSRYQYYFRRKTADLVQRPFRRYWFYDSTYLPTVIFWILSSRARILFFTKHWLPLGVMQALNKNKINVLFDVP